MNARFERTAAGIHFASTSKVQPQLSETSEEKKRKQNSQHTGGWQHATNEKQMCMRP